MTFDLTCRIPDFTIDAARQSARLVLIDVGASEGAGEIIEQIEGLLSSTPSTQAVRICIPALGSPHWGELLPSVRSSYP